MPLNVHFTISCLPDIFIKCKDYNTQNVDYNSFVWGLSGGRHPEGKTIVEGY
jgi:hypothetical protein